MLLIARIINGIHHFVLIASEGPGNLANRVQTGFKQGFEEVSFDPLICKVLWCLMMRAIFMTDEALT